MNTVILLIYISSGFGTGATGGPAMISMPSVQACHEMGAAMKKDLGSKFDWYKCFYKDEQK